MGQGRPGARAVTKSHSPARAPAGISLHVDSLTDHSCSAESDGEKLPCRAGDPLCESGSECKDKYEDLDDDEEDDEEGERDLAPPKPVTSSPLTGVEAPLLSPPPEAAPRGGGGGKMPLGSRTSPGAPQPASKPKLWSLAEIATSDLKQPSLGPGCAPPGLPAAAAPASSGAPPGGSPYPASPLLGRHLYYTSPFYGNYTNYGNLNAALQGQGLLRYNSAAAAPGEALHSAPKAATDAGKAGAHPLEPHYRPAGGGYEPKKGRLSAALGASGEGGPAAGLARAPERAAVRDQGDPWAWHGEPLLLKETREKLECALRPEVRGSEGGGGMEKGRGGHSCPCLAVRLSPPVLDFYLTCYHPCD